MAAAGLFLAILGGAAFLLKEQAKAPISSGRSASAAAQTPAPAKGTESPSNLADQIHGKAIKRSGSANWEVVFPSYEKAAGASQIMFSRPFDCRPGLLLTPLHGQALQQSSAAVLVRIMGEREADGPARVFCRDRQTNFRAGGTPGGWILRRGNPSQRRLGVPGGPVGKKFTNNNNVAVSSFFERERPGYSPRRVDRSRIVLTPLVRLSPRTLPALGCP